MKMGNQLRHQPQIAVYLNCEFKIARFSQVLGTHDR